MFVKYTPKHPHLKVVPIVGSDGSATTENVFLNPGANEVSDEKWEKIKASLADEISAGTVKPFTVKTKKSGQDAKAKTLKDVPAGTAAMIVAACLNKDTLRAWFKDNLPDEIALLVVKRMRQLNMDIDEISGSESGFSASDIIDESKGEAAGSGENEETDKLSVSGESSLNYDEMSYNELKSAAKAKGIDPMQKKEELIAALKGKQETAEPGETAGSGDEIPDFDNPDARVN